MKFESAKQEDLPTINNLILKEFPYTKQSEQKIEERFSNPNFFFFKITDSGKLAGFIEFHIHESSAFIRGFAVLPEFRGKGYGKFLLEKSLSLMLQKNISEIKLLVSKENQFALNLYSSFGFQQTPAPIKKIAGKEVAEMHLLLVQ